MSQIQKIKKWLEDGNAIDTMQAVELFGAYRLSAAIYYLKNKHNMKIVSIRKRENKRNYVVYVLDRQIVNNKESIWEKICRIVKNNIL